MNLVYQDQYVEVYEVDGFVYIHAAGDGYTVAGWPSDRVVESLTAALLAIKATL